MEILETKTDIGLIRTNNEDVVCTISHPKNKSYKLLLVADGMGGKDNGEIASSYVSLSIGKWFLNRSVKTLSNLEETEKLLIPYIKKLNSNLINKYGEDSLGTTLTLAIVNKTNTIIFNVGDSRAYIYKKNNLIQLTEDDSDVWMYYKYGNVKKDDLRYFVNNSIINACIGINNEICKVKTTIIDNNYDILLLLTDGVTDLITDKKIKNLIKRTNKRKLLDAIIHEAVYVDQNLKIPASLKRKKYMKYIVPFKGRDNASGAIYIKEV